MRFRRRTHQHGSLSWAVYTYVIDIQYGSDCAIRKGFFRPLIGEGGVKYFLIDRRVGNLIDPWSCRSFDGELETDDSLPPDLKDR